VVYAFAPAPQVPREPARVSAILGHLAEADALAYQEQFGTAAEVLRTALAAAPGDPMAERAEARLAELASRQQAEADRFFADLKQYPAAYAAYRTLQRSFPGAFADNPENAARLDLLDEARQVRYASLERLDAARRQRSGVVEALEKVIAAYPAATGSTAPSLVASLAAEEMVDHLAGSAGIAGSDEPRLKALETARSQCTSPLALAHLEVALGRYYLEERGDADAARQWGEQALTRSDPAAVAMAKDFLAGLPRAAAGHAP
jgi:tetratricopeptide (TPR) repeat protein